MAPHPTPEIVRIPLEMLCLQIKAMREDEDVKTFLGPFPSFLYTPLSLKCCLIDTPFLSQVKHWILPTFERLIQLGRL